MNGSDTMPRRGVLLLLVAALAIVWFGTLDYRLLIKTDEARYAEIAREMVVSGDWITPRSNDFKYFYKPPLQYWATAAAFEAFGINEWTARLWTALTGFLGVLVTWLVAARLWSPRIAFAAAAILASSVMWVAMGHFAALDMGLAFFLSSSVAAFVFAQRDEATALERRIGMLLAWAAAALAVLSKGLVGLVLPGAAAVAYMLWMRDWRLITRLHWLPGLALFLALAAPWFIAVSLSNPEFFHFFFIHEHFERFLTRVHGRYEPPWYFGPVLAAGLLPWTLAVGHAIAAGVGRAATGRFRPERFLLCWCVVVFVFFSASSSKLPSYLVPIGPALAMLIAIGLERASGRFRSVTWGTVIVLGVVIAIAAAQLGSQPRGSIPVGMLAAYQPWLVGAGIAIGGAGTFALLAERRGRSLVATGVVAAGGLIGTQLVISGHETLSELYSAYHVVRKLDPAPARDVPFYSVDTYDHALPFYLGRTVTMVAYRDELAAAIAWEPEKFLPDLDTFRNAWMAAPVAYAFMRPQTYADFLNEGLPMREVARDPRRVIVSKP